MGLEQILYGVSLGLVVLVVGAALKQFVVRWSVFTRFGGSKYAGDYEGTDTVNAKTDIEAAQKVRQKVAEQFPGPVRIKSVYEKKPDR